jgi:hypothetical protein
MRSLRRERGSDEKHKISFQQEELRKYQVPTGTWKWWVFLELYLTFRAAPNLISFGVVCSFPFGPSH